MPVFSVFTCFYFNELKTLIATFGSLYNAGSEHVLVSALIKSTTQSSDRLEVGIQDKAESSIALRFGSQKGQHSAH